MATGREAQVRPHPKLTHSFPRPGGVVYSSQGGKQPQIWSRPALLRITEPVNSDGQAYTPHIKPVCQGHRVKSMLAGSISPSRAVH